MSEPKHVVYRKKRLKKILRKCLKMSDDQLSTFLRVNGCTDDRDGCIKLIKERLPYMMGALIE